MSLIAPWREIADEMEFFDEEHPQLPPRPPTTAEAIVTGLAIAVLTIIITTPLWGPALHT